ncbi:DUF1631 family protein [Reinekea sp. G2M2-21]|uniref:DUF1631 family protein n=1 Tax=Reinekea sp. G2M2-21 TaxID=2788942 RepID=UPI0018ABD2AB|nr:DUF1631 family protein [Reinekea sp. G2M2-21]
MNKAATTSQISPIGLAKRYPDIKRLTALGDRLQTVIPNIMDEFFSAADDFLFKLAEKSSLESADYFDQLRVLRKRKVQVRQHVLDGVRRWIEGGAQSLPIASQPLEANPSPGDFSLMDDVVLERTLATDSFFTRLIGRSGSEWLAFHERMVALTCQKKLSNKNTPFNPSALGHIVLKEIELLDFPFKSALMLFRLFDDLAIPRMMEFYRDANEWLIAEGILPNLNLQSTRAEKPRADSQMFDTLRANLAGNTTEHWPLSGGTGTPMQQSGHGHAPSGGMLVDPALLRQMISTMASFQAQTAPEAHKTEDLRHWAVAQANAVTQQVAGTLEAGTVSLVAMLFEYILDDAKLSVHMKQLLARMQIPIIKVAILDKDFFTDTDNSARLLLNRMARAATGWEPDADIQNDMLLDGMERIVTQLNREFEDDLSIFDRLLEDFDQLQTRYRDVTHHSIAQLQQREVASFEQHQKQDRARLIIDALLENQVFPGPITELLKRHWYRLMSGIFNKQGESKAWKTTARIARELVWTLQPSVQLTHITRFKEIVPKVLDGVDNGLKAVGLSEAERAGFLGAIQDHHALHSNPVNEAIWDAQQQLDYFEVQSQKAEHLVDEPAPLVVDEPVVTLKSADLSYYMDQVEQLKTEQWFDIELSENHWVRGCLTLIVGQGSKYVFTDFRGDKVAERSAIGLAMAMRNEQIVALPDDPLFDRKINELVDDLGQKTATQH